jgi:hypothetical protein
LSAEKETRALSGLKDIDINVNYVGIKKFRNKVTIVMGGVNLSI